MKSKRRGISRCRSKCQVFFQEDGPKHLGEQPLNKVKKNNPRPNFKFQ